MAKKQTSSSQCFTPHVILHATFGLGLGLIISTLLSTVSPVTIFGLGVIFAVIGVFGEFFLKKK